MACNPFLAKAWVEQAVTPTTASILGRWDKAGAFPETPMPADKDKANLPAADDTFQAGSAALCSVR